MTYWTYSQSSMGSILRLPKTPTATFQLLVHELFIHDQKGTKSMKVVCRSLSSVVISAIRNVRAFANVDDVCHAVAINRDLRKHTSVPPLRDALEILRQITTIDSHSRHERVHAGA